MSMIDPRYRNLKMNIQPEAQGAPAQPRGAFGGPPKRNWGRKAVLAMKAIAELDPRYRGGFAQQQAQFDAQDQRALQAQKEAERKAKMAEFAKTLTPEQQTLFGLNPNAAIEGMTQQAFSAPQERKMIKGADGRNYYADTQEPVLPNVQAPAPDRKTVTGADGYLYYADTGGRVLPDVRKPEPVRAPSDPWKMVATGDGNSVMYNSRTGESREFNKAPEFVSSGAVDGAQSGGFEDFESPFNADEFRSYNGGGADFIPASFTQGDVGGRYGQAGLDPAFVTGGQGTPTGRKPTEYDKVRDREMAKDLTEWTLGGQAQAASQLRRLKDVIERLDSGENVSGRLVGNLPFKSITAPASKDVEDTVGSVVQQSLKAILGGQFAQQEAEQLLKRAYDPGLDEKLNAKRLKILYDELVYRSRMNDYAARYADQNGTLEGFDGYLPQIGDFFTTEQSAPKEIGDMSDDDLLRDLGLN